MSDVSKLVPGFDFLQGLVKNAGGALPGVPGLQQIGQWVAPTLNPEELGKRIEELRTVQFWLEQNARMLAATIQALEVQRMTLSTLKTMNVPLAELKDALKLPEVQAAAPAAAAVKVGKAVAKKAVKGMGKAAAKAASKGPAAVDPLQWWGALTQQFSQVAANAMKDSASEAAKGLASSLVKQSIDAAGDTLRKAASVPGAVASAAKSMAREGSASPPARKTAPRRRAG